MKNYQKRTFLEDQYNKTGKKYLPYTKDQFY